MKESIEKQFKEVDRLVNILIFVGLAFFSALHLVLEQTLTKGRENEWIHILWLVLFFGFLIGLVIHTFRAKKKVMLSFGLGCSACGHVPLPVTFAESLYSARCKKCGASLEIGTEPVGAGQPDNPPVKL